MSNSFLTRLRLHWATVTKTYGYSMDYAERVYRIYLNHNKVIHFRQGHPVYSLSTPAMFTKPAANLFARSVFSVIQQRPIPNLLSFAVNDQCNARCYHCSFFGGGVAEPGRHVMTTDECVKLIHDAQRLGVSVINIVGGEPTLRDDLPQILRAVDKELSTVVMFTNGSILAERVREYQAAGLDSVYVSIDAANPAEHDKRRNAPKLFERALRGLAVAKSLGMSVGLSASLTPDDYRSGELDRLVELAKRVGAHEVVVFDVMPTGRMQDRDDLVDNEAWVDEMIDSMEKYNRDPAYPGVIAFAYVTSYRSTGCSCGISYFYISPYGDVNPCDFNHKVLGNVLQEPLWKIWDRATREEDFRRAKWGGCKVKDSEYRQRVPESVAAAPDEAHCDHPVQKLLQQLQRQPEQQASMTKETKR